jgi:16S rRNA (cytosine967-C5)-methyltransferase
VTPSTTRRTRISPARRAAYDCLLKVEADRAFTSVLLPEYEEQLQPLDRGLCHEIVLGTLRRQIYLDRVIDALSNGKKLDIEIRVILRFAIFQLAFLERVPAHAAVNDAVALASRAKRSSARGLVNAVLRRAAAGLPKLEFADELDRISVETSHPRWLIEQWSEEFGKTEAFGIAAANNKTPRLAFRKTLRGRNLDLARFERSEIVEGCYIADTFDTELRKIAESGEIYFQDEGSQLVADAVTLAAGERFLDVCASPGGKSTTIVGKAMLDSGEGTGLAVAGDLTDRRVRLLRDACLKQDLRRINILQYDAAVSLPFADASFDVVLVDAPCTGTGTIRHNPEIRYFVQPENFCRMQKTQLSILQNAARAVRPGCHLTYSTCSLEREENEAVCEMFLSENDRFRPVPPNVDNRFLTAAAYARTFPHRDSMDGFFIATFRCL